MNNPTARGGGPPLPDRRTCPNCGFDAIQMTDVDAYPDVEHLTCEMCQHRWTVARGSKHVRPLTRLEWMVDDVALPHARHSSSVSSGTPEEWECLTNNRLNALLIGPRHVTTGVVRSLWSQLARPVVQIHRGMPLVLPPSEQAGTIILEDVDRLDKPAQMCVREWLEGAVPRARVISTSTLPVLPMVTMGAFDETLYYRLNVVYVRC